MKKIYFWYLLILIIVALMPQGAKAQNRTQRETSTYVTSQQAMDIGYAFMRTGDGSKDNGTKSSAVRKQAMQLVYTGQATDSLTGTTTDCYYVFTLQPKGFVIVAADERVEPILGYSYDNDFVVANMPAHVRGWLGNYEKQIEAVAKSNLQAEPAIQNKWTRLKSGQSMSTRSGGSVGPLLTTQWDQWWPYNAMCPSIEVGNEQCPTGCTATATAQIMNYWQYPAKGIGHHSYKTKSGTVGKQSASFNETYYQWDSMDANHIEAISTLMYHVGVAMAMDYAPGGSEAYLSSAEIGLQRYFDYSDSSIYLHRENYDDDSWIELLKSSIANNKPVLYEGYDGSSGHAWVIDGYDNQSLFHMNFGWGGNSDGYYSINTLSVGWYNFNNNQGAVFGICPANSPLNADFEISQGDSVLKFNFYDFSKGAPVQHKWYFGDGDSSTAINPVHFFDSVGLYSVMLVVYNGINIDTVIKDIQISIPQFLTKEMGLGEVNPYIPPVVLDYDMDGKFDFYATGCFHQHLYHNEDTVFTLTTLWSGESLPSSEHGNAYVVDFEHKNRPSILTSEKDGFYWYNNNGSLEQKINSLNDLLKGDGDLFIGDYNGDGEDDIIWGSYLYKNIGDYNFIKVSDYVFRSGQMYDYDGDGDLDIVGAWTYRNDGNDVFVETGEFEPFDEITYYERTFAISGAISDINLDGFPDMIVGPYIYYNSVGEPHYYHTIDTDYPPIYYGSTSSADVNSDGRPDIICNKSFWIEYYENRAGHLIYQDNLQYPLNYYQDGGEYYNYRVPCGGSFIDYNNNNIPDVAIMTPWGSSTFWENTCAIINDPPSTPQNLWTDTLGNSVVLHWDTVSDDHSRYGSITYNIMVGTSPDSFDIKSPLSNIATGKRYAYNKGNAGYAPLWKLNDLPNGTYFWKVQAIDNSLAASPFSETGVFVINGRNIPPFMSDITSESFLNRGSYLSALTMKDHFVDRESDSLQGIMIMELPTDGYLYLRNSLVSLNQYIPYSDIDSLCFITNVFKDDSISVKAYDGFGYSEKVTLIRFNVKLYEQKFLQTGVSGAVAWGDYDNDGKVDFASTSGIYHNIGTGFELLTDTVPSAENVLWADVNNDGWLDCLYDGYVLTNLGNGHFSWSTALANWSETSIATGDINNDNMVDYVISGSQNSYAETASRIYTNYANTFSNDSANNALQGFRFGDIVIADFDNDGRQDIIMNGIAEGNQRRTIMFRNEGNGIFSPSSDSIYGLNAGSLCAGDYNRDGAIDLLLCGTQGTMESLVTTLYDNNKTGMLDEHIYSRGNNAFVPTVLGQAKWYDFDNDGFLDVISSGMNAGTHLYKNIGGLYFEEVLNTQLPHLTYTSIDIIDYDGDGYSDILLSGNNEDGVPMIAIYNNCLGFEADEGNESIAVPSNLSADVTAYNVTLSWDEITDNYGSYNVYVRNSEGFVVSPMADTATGFRKVVTTGNAGNLNHYEVKNLPCGTYFWSVQSINNALRGSPFSEEHTFTIVPVEADTVVVYDTACQYYSTGLHTYKRSGVFYERYERELAVDSVVELHLTIHKDCTPIVYVAQHPVSYQDGCSWKSAYSDLQQGIDMAIAVDGDLWIAKGLYQGDGSSEYAFSFCGDLHMYGGFEGWEPKDYDLSLRKFKKHSTILDGQGLQSVILQEWYQSEYALIDGFTIRDGSKYNISGPGLRISNCISQGLQSSPPSIGRFGHENDIINCVINNTNLNYVNVVNSVIAGPNISVTREWSSYTNCVFWDYNGTIPNGVTTYSAMQGHLVSGEGNIMLAYSNYGNSPDSLYAHFMDPENGDFRFLAGSDCINAGTPETSQLELPLVDLQGLPRVSDGRVDMGAFEYYPTQEIHFYDTICNGESVTFHDIVCSATGQYVHPANPDLSLDTLHILHLQVSPIYTIDSILQIPENGYVRDGHTYYQPGTYSFNYTSKHGCDSIINITLCNQLITICDSELPYNCGDTIFDEGTLTGFYTMTSGGEPSLIHLQINPTHIVYDTIIRCEDAWVYVGNVDFHDSLPGDYTVVLQNIYGCDSVVNVHLEVNPSYRFYWYDTIPRGTPYLGHGFYLSPNETTNTHYIEQYRWMATSAGCDSSYVLCVTLTGTPIIYVTQNGTGDGTSWENSMGNLQAALDSAAVVEGDVWVAEGTYYGDGISENALVIPDGVYVYGGFAGNEPEDYDLSLRNFAAHPTILDGQHTQRTVFHDWTWVGNTPILDGFTIQNGFSDYGGNVYGGEPRIHVNNCVIKDGASDGNAGGLANASVRNSIIINNTTTYWGSAMLDCDANNCIIVGNNASEYGYTTKWSTLSNCILWNNIGYPEYGCTLTYSAVEGQDIWGDGNFLLAHSNDGTSPDSNYVRFVDPENGDFRIAYGSACINAGTPDIIALGLPSVDLQGLSRVLDGRIDMGAYEYYPVPVVEMYDTICEGYDVVFFDSTYNIEGRYVHHSTNDVTLDTLHVLHLTISASDSVEIFEIACDAYEWNGEIYTESNTYVQTLNNHNGCDSVVTLHLTVNYGTHNVLDTTVCENFTWSNGTGETYTISDTYIHAYINNDGCASVDTLHLTVNVPTDGDTIAVVCGSFDWHGYTNLTESGDYTDVLTNAAGCDSTVTLHLTVNVPTESDTTAVVCGSLDWHGYTNLTESGDYTDVLTNAAGCDSTVILHLTVNNPEHTATTEVACESFTWNGETYTESGVYTYSHEDARGCTQVDTLHLTINNPVHTVTTETVCGSYTWTTGTGITYTESGTYLHSHEDVNGCLQVDTLHLTINTPTAGDTTAIVCGNFNWYEYFDLTQSGDYTHTLTNAAGCDSTVILHLTVNQPVTTTSSATICDSELPYVWNGVTFNEAGTQSLTLQAVNGCDSVVTLTLTVNQSATGVDEQEACDSFEWIDGVTYTESNTSATYTLTNAVGCDSIVTLHLAINESATSEFTIVTNESCYVWNGVEYCETGDYTQTLQTEDGCDSVVTLHLTIETGISDHSLNANMNVYPNPTSNIVKVELTINNGQSNSVAIQLYDMYGKLLDVVNVGHTDAMNRVPTGHSMDASNMSNTHGMFAQTTQIDLSRYANGVYFIKAVSEGDVLAVRKVVKN